MKMKRKGNSYPFNLCSIVQTCCTWRAVGLDHPCPSRGLASLSADGGCFSKRLEYLIFQFIIIDLLVGYLYFLGFHISDSVAIYV